MVDQGTFQGGEEVLAYVGTKEDYEDFLIQVVSVYPSLKETGKEKKVNHYFSEVDIGALLAHINDRIHFQQEEELKKIIFYGKRNVVRTYSCDESSSKIIIRSEMGEEFFTEFGTDVTRDIFEFEQLFSMTHQELDQAVLLSGGDYVMKVWREKIEFEGLGDNVTMTAECLSGIGYLVRFDLNSSERDSLHSMLSKIIDTSSCHEIRIIQQDELDDLKRRYSENWLDYYDTGRIIELIK